MKIFRNHFFAVKEWLFYWATQQSHLPLHYHFAFPGITGRIYTQTVERMWGGCKANIYAADKNNALADVLTPFPLQPPPTWWELFRVGCPWVPPSFWMVYWWGSVESVPLPSPVLMRESVRVESVETQDWVRGSLRHSTHVLWGTWERRSAHLVAAHSYGNE